MNQMRVEMWVRSAFAVGFLAFVSVGGAVMAKRLTVKTVRERLFALACPARKVFVELNGGMCRLVGRRLCNGVYRADDGQILKKCERRDVSDPAARAIQFARWLDGRGMRYIYVQAPSKVDRAGVLSLPVVPNESNAMADDFIARLKRAGVAMFDLREALAVTPEDVGRQFYRTDHHWNNDAVFAAFGLLAPYLADLTGTDPVAVTNRTDAAAWRREVLPACFLGSRGRRTGRLFAGVDDLIVYTPRFATRMSLDIPSKKIHRKGSFQETNMWRAKTLGEGVRTDCYSSLYVGGIYPLVCHKNEQVPIKARILVIGDSFVRPLEAFLSTVVAELVVIDPRRVAPGVTMIDCAKRMRPDIVLQVSTAGGFFSDVIGRAKTGRHVLFDYGLQEPPVR